MLKIDKNLFITSFLVIFSLLFFVLANYLDSKFIKKITIFSLTSGAIIAIYGILQHFGIDKKFWPNDDVMSRVFSTLGQPNWLAPPLMHWLNLIAVAALVLCAGILAGTVLRP